MTETVSSKQATHPWPTKVYLGPVDPYPSPHVASNVIGELPEWLKGLPC